MVMRQVNKPYLSGKDPSDGAGGIPAGERRRRRRFSAGWRVFASAVVLSLALAGFCACGEEETAEEEPETFEVAMITDDVGVKDGSFHESTWNAIQAFGEENGITSQAIPSENSEEAYMDAIRQARQDGAKLIVLSGSQFETIAYQAQEKYKDLYFVLMDGVPRDEKYNYETAGNCADVLFAEEQAGFLAGYAAVSEGFTSIGFMGGDKVPPVKRYGYGFVQGVSAAARDKGISGIDLKYTYTGTFEASDEIESEAFVWFDEGTEVIFACGGSIGESVMAAAETAGGSVIGVDSDQSALSETVVTSAKKETGRAITDVLKNYKRNNFPGGSILNYSVENDGIGLEMTNSRLTLFTQEDYDALLGQIRSGERTIVKDTDKKSIKSLAGDQVEFHMVKE